MKNNKKKILIVVLFVMAVLVTSRTHATPLYGGYNGESETWFEYRIAGVNTLLFSVKVFLGGIVMITDGQSFVFL
jgi:ABC-type cobalt transport system substrate-binding protein